VGTRVGEERIFNMVQSRPDWTISRQRAWGVPITAFYCSRCKELLRDDRIFDFVADIYEKGRRRCLVHPPAGRAVAPGARCAKCQATEFTKGHDILDVWFDSGASHEAVLTSYAGLHWPSDMYLEGNDQYRGWFNSSS